jgi:hypothetical protein
VHRSAECIALKCSEAGMHYTSQSWILKKQPLFSLLSEALATVSGLRNGKFCHRPLHSVTRKSAVGRTHPNCGAASAAKSPVLERKILPILSPRPDTEVGKLFLIENFILRFLTLLAMKGNQQ